MNKSGKPRAHNQQYLRLVTGGYAYTHALKCGLGSVLSELAGLEALMGNKDKGGRNAKKQATKSLKQKRAEKKAKREAVKGRPNSGPS